MERANMPSGLEASLKQTKVTYKKLGASGLQVSVPIVGAMSFGQKSWQSWVLEDEEEIQNILKGAYDRGVNTWDTANVYSNGASEAIIGRAIQKFNIPRHKLVLLTKIFGYVGEQPDIRQASFANEMSQSKDYANQGGLSRTAIFNAVNGCLARLQTDYIDLLQIHRFDATVTIEETMKALHDLVQLGKVRYIGASSMWTYQFAQMQFTAERNGWTKFISMQNHYSLCYREEEREMNRFCHETGVGLIAWAPLYRGLLARQLGAQATARQGGVKGSLFARESTGPDEEIIRRVQELAEAKEWTMSQVALAWVIQKGSIPTVGFSSVARLEEGIDVRGKELTPEEIVHLEEPYQSKAVVGHS
ncbi:alcohol dehydrogenase [Penicillium sp. IBT 18751x]|nr:alcohol dehydrogenase [Penicillium sp. IBT 18751x]